MDGGQVVEETVLKFSGEVSVFSGELTVDRTGDYVLEVLANSPTTENFGMVQVPVSVE